MNKKIVRITVDLVVDSSVDSTYLVQEMNYDFISKNEEVIYETEIIDHEELTY